MRRLALSIVLILSACPKRHVDAAAEAMAAALGAVDRAWVGRDAGGLDAVARALDDVPDQTSPEVAWRRARLGVARGIMAPDARTQRRDFADARGAAMSCVLSAPTLSHAWQIQRDADAIRDLPYDRLGCAAWAGYAWARWLSTLEPGAGAVDVPAVLALLERGAAEPEKERLEITVWGRAIVEAVQGSPSKLLLDAHRRDDDDAWVWWADVQRWLPSASGLLIPDRGPRAPEERVAYARLSETTDKP